MVLLFGVSCQKQKPDVDSGFTRTLAERQRLEACSNIDLAHNLLDYGNTINLFKCFSWNNQFPSLFRAVTEIDQSSWNHVFGPIDSVFLNDRVRRDRFFGHIRELDNKGGLDDLSFVLTALNETNFFDALKEAFICAETPKNQLCEKRKERLLSRKDIELAIELIGVEPDSFNSVSELLKIFLNSVGEEAEPLRDEINSFFHLPLFKVLRLKLISAMSDKILDGEGVTDRDKKVFLDLILSAKKETLNPWLYEWIKSDQMTEESFVNLLRFPIDKTPYVIRDLKAMEIGYEQGVACESFEGNNYVEINLKTHLTEYLQDMVKSNYNEFFRLSLKNINTLQTGIGFCPILASYSPKIHYIDPKRNGDIVKGRHNVNFHTVLNRVSELFLDKNSYEIIKYVFKITNAENEILENLPGLSGVPLRDKLYLIDLVMGDIAGYGHEFNKVVGINSRSFYNVLFKILKRMDAKAFLHVGDLAMEIFQEEHKDRFKAVAKFWRFFTQEEQNFLFRFIDRHLKDSTNYTLLFDFYTKMLDELPIVGPLIADTWIGSDEKMENTYHSAFDLVDKLSGKDVLQDFQKFFSRDHVVRILEILAKGEQFKIEALAEYNYVFSDKFRERMQKTAFAFDWSNQEEAEGKKIAECITDMDEAGGTIYVLAKRLPRSCESLNTGEMSLQLYKWMSFISQDYDEKNKIQAINRGDEPTGMFDEQGLFSPALLNSNVVSAMVLNEVFDRDGVPEYVNNKPRYDGLSYLMESFHHHIYELDHIKKGRDQKGFQNEINDALDVFSRFIKTDYENHRLHRSALMKKYTNPDNFDRTDDVVEKVMKGFEGYLDWLIEGNKEIVESRSLGVFDPKYSCKNFLNEKVESTQKDHTCPSPEIIKREGTKIIARHVVSHDSRYGTPVGQLTKALIPRYGFLIPLGSKKAEPHHISLKELFSMLYDMTAPDLKINQTKIPFIDRHGRESKQPVTTMERIDIVIRDSGFKRNYLGAQYMNDVAHTDNYNKSVKSKKKLLYNCSRIPIARCGRKMEDDDKRLVKNILATYDGLLDANNGRNEEPKFKYGNFMRALLGALVGSSSKKAQKVKFFPLSNDTLLKHNGIILVEMSRLTTNSNAGRVLNDRIGRTRQDFENFINGKPFQMVNKSFMRGFHLRDTQRLMESLLRKVIKPDKNGSSLFDYMVDWLDSLSYSDLRLVEDTAARLMWMGAYLGTPQLVFDNYESNSNTKEMSRHYSGNNIFGLLKAADKAIDMWPNLREAFIKKDYDLLKLIRKANTIIYFLNEKLSSNENPEENIYYQILNEAYTVLDNMMFKKHLDVRIVDSSEQRFQGLDFLVKFSRKVQNVEDFYNTVEDVHGYVDRLFYKTKAKKVLTTDFFKTVITNIKKIFDEDRLESEPMREYMRVTSKNAICYLDDIACQSNYHYDEPASIISYLTNIQDKTGRSYFDVLTDTVLVEEKSNLLDFYDDISSYLILRRY